MLVKEYSTKIENTCHIVLKLQEKDDLTYFSLLKNNSLVRIHDPILSQIKDLIKLKNPTKQIKPLEMDELAREFLTERGGDFYGSWVYYPWRNILVHILPEEDFAEVRTVRNKYKITAEEQAELSQKKIGVVGLSVGQSVAIALALERSFGELRIADFDSLELSNLNRLRSGVHYLGEKKTCIVKREIAEIDPYLKVTVYEEGLTEKNMDDFLLKGGALDLLIDECDSLDMKLMMRESARNYRIPVLMDTSDRGMLDVERFDCDPTREIFHGMVEGLDSRSLKNLPMKEKIPVVLKITGLETLSTRMKASLLEVNQSITSWPQLATSVFLGGALGAHASRKLLLGQPLASGRYYVDFDELLGLGDTSDAKHQTKKSINQQVESTIKLTNHLSSSYRLSNQELEEMVEFANLAPSGGNIQPWSWFFDERGVLHLLHDQVRSESLLDFKGTGSLMAFGAALENIRIWSAHHGIKIEICEHVEEFGAKEIASIYFISKGDPSIQLSKDSLYSFVPQRITDRLNHSRVPLTELQLDQIKAVVSGTEFQLKVFDHSTSIDALAEINGCMDWVRMLNKQGYKDFVEEIRWTPEEALATKDGIDIATFDFGAAERALLKIISNKQAMDVIRKFKLGQGFTKISDDTFKSASTIMVLTAKDFNPKTYLSGGAIIQRLWVIANKLGVSFQPVTASLFMFHRYFKGGQSDFSEFEGSLIESSYKSFKELLELKDGEALFMFRLNITNGDVVKSYRRPVKETLRIAKHV
ncbi:Rv1355c family protein [Mongoliitalea daihaiensis]|uniref:Rv1355c family protein n=1 Tax=Mongoliitalea daihaiensis TaxID=2782006 RepID=UPI001F01C7F9|nr:Rv1355c family protein [Mongoliitalea daihaiensis]UJP65045.1 Rv1355c family protein [Mongoliitalea daihaiensis]